MHKLFGKTPLGKRTVGGRRSVLISWLLSYASVLLVPVLIGALFHAQTRHAIEIEVRAANAAVFRQAQRLIDGRLADMERLGLQIAMNLKTQTLMYARNELSAFHRYTAATLIKDLSLYKLSSAFVESFYIVFANIDSVISHDTFCRSDMFFEITHGDLGISYEQWYSTIVENHVRDIVTFPETRQDGPISRNVTAYMQSLPLEDPKLTTATLVMIINEERLREAIRGVAWLEKGTVLAISRSNTILSSTNTTYPATPVRYEDLPGDSGFYYKGTGRTKIAISYMTSSVGDIKIVSLLPFDLLTAGVGAIREIAYTGILLCLGAGGMVAYVLIRRNYHPVQILLQSLRKRADFQIHITGNEYDRIQAAFSEAIEEQDENNRVLEQRKDILRDLVVSRLLKNEFIGAEESKYITTAIGTATGRRRFAVAVLEVIGVSIRQSVDASNADIRRTIRILIAATIDGLSGDNCRLIPVANLDGRPCCLFSLEAGKSGNHEKAIESLCGRLYNILTQEYGVKVAIGLSSIHLGVACISRAYDEAADYLDRAIFMNREGVVSYRKTAIPGAPDYHGSFSPDDERQLAKLLRMGELEKARVIIDQVFASIRSAKDFRTELYRCMIFDLAGSMARTVEETDADEGSVLLGKTRTLERIADCRSLRELEEEVVSLLERICGFMESRKRSHNVRLRDDIIQYIAANANDVDICVTSIAEHFGMSSTYISQFYKEQTGERLLDGINRTRLENAKALLRKPGNSVRDVARSVGLHDTNGLIRIFKKYEGVTPGRYSETT